MTRFLSYPMDDWQAFGYAKHRGAYFTYQGTDVMVMQEMGPDYEWYDVRIVSSNPVVVDA